MIPIEVPPLGESVTQATLLSWRKKDGERVAVDEPICELETDKANADLPATSAGVLHPLKKEGDIVKVGEIIAQIDESGEATKRPSDERGGQESGALPPPPVLREKDREEAKRTEARNHEREQTAAAPEDFSPAVRILLQEHHLDPRAITATGPGGRLTREDVEAHLAKRDETTKERPEGTEAQRHERKGTAEQRPLSPAAPITGMHFDSRGIYRVPMSKIRKRIAERLVQAQHTAAILTTFNEVDLTEVIALRAKYKEQFQKSHGVALGFMSFFARAVVQALGELPQLNAFIDGDDIIYHNYVNLGIAVSTERGLVLPVLRNVHEMSFAKIEQEIKRLASAARDGKLTIEELSGGTFSITNGGIFGSLLSTPILTPPQSGILGMHDIQKRPVVRDDDRIEVRSMMYVALSYDHRLVDGKEAITFLVRLKQLLEDPARLMLEI